jgi:hypothetical protein
MEHVWSQIDLASPSGVIDVLRRGTEANLTAACRRGSVDEITGGAGDVLIATGDLHDNPMHLARIVEMAGMEDGGKRPAHITLHELIHGDDLQNDMDMSYRVLVKAAALKSAFPGHVHVLLANHELSQISGAGVMKEGVNCVKAFNDGVEYVFGQEAAAVSEAIGAFIRSMPLGLRATTGGGTRLLCTHSLPEGYAMARFDASILERPLVEEDYQPRTGSAHLMCWGRDYDPAHLAALGSRWGVDLFIVGHEKAEAGWLAKEPNTLILNSDHERGAVARVDLSARVSLDDLALVVQRLDHADD